MKQHRILIGVGLLGLIAALSALFLTAKSSIDWMVDLAVEDVTTMEIVTYQSGATHIAYQPTPEEQSAVVALCNGFDGAQTQWEPVPTEEELRVTMYAKGSHTLILYVKEATNQVALQVDEQYFLLDADQTSAWLALAETLEQDEVVVHDTYAYGDGHTYSWLCLTLEKNGTYSLSDSLDANSGRKGAYAVDGTTLKLTDETTTQNYQYVFQIVGDTLVFDLENSQNLFYDIPDGAVFGAVDLDVLLHGNN